MRHAFLLPLMLGSALAVLSACEDHVTDLDGLMDSAEAEAVLRSADELPLLPHFIDAADDASGHSTALVRAREMWDAGTGAGSAVGDPHGATRRRAAVRYAVPVLVESVPAQEWGAARERIEEWMSTASAMLRHLSIPEVESRLESAARELRQSDAAVTERARVYHLLLAGSDLVETTPRFVARSMTREAAGAVERASGRTEPPVSSGTLERARRLKDWAVRAIDEGDDLLALQRAYYAIQLLEAP